MAHGTRCDTLPGGRRLPLVSFELFINTVIIQYRITTARISGNGRIGGKNTRIRGGSVYVTEQLKKLDRLEESCACLDVDGGRWREYNCTKREVSSAAWTILFGTTAADRGALPNRSLAASSIAKGKERKWNMGGG